jgi:ATP-binding cassette subfamily G (WHITE) protein 2 (SNQ2)
MSGNTRGDDVKKARKETTFRSDVTLSVNDGPFDFEKCLHDIVKKYARYCMHEHILMIYVPRRREEAHHKSRELGVMFKDLKVVGLGASTSYQPTLGSVLNPFNVIEAIDAIRHPPIKDILTGFEGVIRPGEMLCE